jgi:hypothetical protein
MEVSQMVQCRSSRVPLVIGIAFIFLFAGCAAQQYVPIYADPDIENMNFDTITLLPVVDARTDKSHKFDIEGSIGDRVAKKLKSKGYTVIAAGTATDFSVIPDDEIAEMEPLELSSLGPEDATIMLVVFVNDASAKMALGYSFKMETTAILLNKPTKAMLWKDKGIGSAGQGGLAGCLMAGLTKDEAMSGAVDLMLKSFPLAPSKRK